MNTATDPQALRRRIAEKAYELYLKRNRANGHDIEDWLEAERLVRHETAPAVAGVVVPDAAAKPARARRARKAPQPVTPRAAARD